MNPTAASVEEVAAVLKLLGDKTRLTMMALLDRREYCVCELVDMFQMSQPAVSQHLRKLKDAGLVNETRKAQWIFYAVNKDHSLYSLIQGIFAHLSNLPEKTTTVSCE
jgi:ArsR family transcriptional regulator